MSPKKCSCFLSEYINDFFEFIGVFEHGGEFISENEIVFHSLAHGFAVFCLLVGGTFHEQGGMLCFFGKTVMLYRFPCTFFKVYNCRVCISDFII